LRCVQCDTALVCNATRHLRAQDNPSLIRKSIKKDSAKKRKSKAKWYTTAVLCLLPSLHIVEKISPCLHSVETHHSVYILTQKRIHDTVWACGGGPVYTPRPIASTATLLQRQLLLPPHQLLSPPPPLLLLQYYLYYCHCALRCHAHTHIHAHCRADRKATAEAGGKSGDSSGARSVQASTVLPYPPLPMLSALRHHSHPYFDTCTPPPHTHTLSLAPLHRQAP
jgi:hypothetical protein